MSECSAECLAYLRSLLNPTFPLSRPSDVDVAYQYLTFFLDDDEKLEEIRREYGAGRMKTYDVKQVLVEVLQGIVARHQVSLHRRAGLAACDVRPTTYADTPISLFTLQEARAKVTEEEVDHFMSQAKFKTKTSEI